MGNIQATSPDRAPKTRQKLLELIGNVVGGSGPGFGRNDRVGTLSEARILRMLGKRTEWPALAEEMRWSREVKFFMVGLIPAQNGRKTDIREAALSFVEFAVSEKKVDMKTASELLFVVSVEPDAEIRRRGNALYVAAQPKQK